MRSELVLSTLGTSGEAIPLVTRSKDLRGKTGLEVWRVGRYEMPASTPKIGTRRPSAVALAHVRLSHLPPVHGRRRRQPTLHRHAAGMPPASWTRMHGDIFTTGQRFHRNICGARYKTTTDFLLQLVCNIEVCDFEAMAVQAAHPDALNPT